MAVVLAVVAIGSYAITQSFASTVYATSQWNSALDRVIHADVAQSVTRWRTVGHRRRWLTGSAGRSGTLRNLGRVPEAAEDARRALALARQIGYQIGEALALACLGAAAHYAGDVEMSLSWARQAGQIDPADLPGWVGRGCVRVMAGALMEAGQAASARCSCADGLARAREAGDLWDQAEFLFVMAELDLEAGRMPEAVAHLREALRLAVQVGDKLRLTDCLDVCGLICAATGRWAEAITLWAAYAARNTDAGTPELPQEAHRRQEPFRKAAQALGPAQLRAAEERGAAMSLATAVEFVTLVAPQPHRRPHRRLRRRSSAPGRGNWSPWSPTAAPTSRSPPSCTSA